MRKTQAARHAVILREGPRPDLARYSKSESVAYLIRELKTAKQRLAAFKRDGDAKGVAKMTTIIKNINQTIERTK